MSDDPNPSATGSAASPGTDTIFERRAGVVLRTLLASLWTWACLVVDRLDLEPWRGSIEWGSSRSVLVFTALGLGGFACEIFDFFRSTPREVRIEGGDLLLWFSKRREHRIVLHEVREVRIQPPDLMLKLAWGEVYRFRWRKSVRTKVLEGLTASLQLQPVPGDRTDSLRRPLLYPGEPIPDPLPSGDRDCPQCRNRYPSHYWFVFDGQTREVICRPCGERLDLERAEARIAATGISAEPPARLRAAGG